MSTFDHAVLLDIEGTIGDVTFVREVLFPYSRERLQQTLFAHWHDPVVAAAVAQARELSGQSLDGAVAATEQFLTWLDADQKITPLKTVQGFIWREGYAQGDLKAHLYGDAVEAFQQWRAQGLRLYIYSSGSVEAQKLYLAHSTAGNVSAYFDGFFDTKSGPKVEPSSYLTIAESLSLSPQRMVFFSDMKGEISAALRAGLKAIRIDRTRAADYQGADDLGPVSGSFLPFLAKVDNA